MPDVPDIFLIALSVKADSSRGSTTGLYQFDVFFFFFWSTVS